jgi:hypothetical protein
VCFHLDGTKLAFISCHLAAHEVRTYGIIIIIISVIIKEYSCIPIFEERSFIPISKECYFKLH